MQKQFAKERCDECLSYTIYAHRTPLIRQLKNVDMWMQTNKAVNLKIAAQCIDGLLLQPGQIFSFWRCVGKPTARKGYLLGMVLQSGRFMPGVGGGLCQLSNLIYWMTLHTPLTVTERYRHSYDVFPDANRTQPFGSGATCVYNYRDLQIANNTESIFQLQIQFDDRFLKAAWLSNEPSGCRYRVRVYEKNHRIESAYWGGYTRHNQLYRSVHQLDGTFVRDEWLADNHAIMMYNPLLESKRA